MKPIATSEQAKNDDNTLAQAFTDPALLSALTISNIIGANNPHYSPNIPLLYKTIRDEVSNHQHKTELSLLSQAKTLDVLFNEMTSASLAATNFETARFYADMALRAQNQCRKTLLAIATIRNPPPKQIVEQQNIALNQQINNSELATAIRGKIKSKNELLEEINAQRLDTRTTQATIPTNPEMATLENCGR